MIDFIGRGFLPPSLPPLFTTMPLAEAAAELLERIRKTDADVASAEQGQRKTKNTNGSLKVVWTTPLTVSFPTKEGKRRTATVPNPYSHLQLCDKIIKGWSLIEKHCQKSKISFSRLQTVGAERSISFRDRGPEQFFGHTSLAFSARLAQKRLEMSSQKRYVLKLDIASFYPSIYTHALPWALGGKRYSKQKLAGIKDLPANQGHELGVELDKAVQCAASGQTKGIPIGPDTSRILSEIIGSSVDDALLSKLKEAGVKLSGLRYVDDFFLFFDDAHSLERAKAILAEAVGEYELELNHSKTAFGLVADEALEAPWVRPLREFQIRDGAWKQRHDIYGFVDLITSLARAYPKDSVALYGAKVLASLRVRFACLKQMIPALWRLVQLDSRAVQVAAETTAKLWPSLQNPSCQGECRLIVDSVMFQLNVFVQNRWEVEATWLLWLILAIRIKMPSDVQNQINAMQHPLVMLGMLKLSEEGLVAALDLSTWKEDLKGEESLKCSSWILAYELFLRGEIEYPLSSDLNPKDMPVMKRLLPFFEELKSKQISFLSASAARAHVASDP